MWFVRGDNEKYCKIVIDFNPFGFAFGGTKAAADMRSFDEILKEFEEFFTIDPKKTHGAEGTGGKLKGRDVNI